MNPKNILFIVLALGGISILFSYRASRSFLEAQAASPPIGAASPDEANAKLEKAIKTMFARDEQVRKADLSVQADVTKNEVTRDAKGFGHNTFKIKLAKRATVRALKQSAEMRPQS
jgi:hypothetical protein